MWTWLRKRVGRALPTSFWEKFVAHAALAQQFSAIYATKKYDGREQLWDECVERVGKRTPVLFLEFGVWKGYSLKYFSDRLDNPLSRFLGFDSFKGLPEDWGHMGSGTFDVSGAMPETSDSRVRFVDGWFQNTTVDAVKIAKAAFQNDPTVIVHLDADLYSSTLFVLCRLYAEFDEYYFIFDEFTTHECRALLNFMQSHGANVTFYSYTGQSFPCQVFGKISNCANLYDPNKNGLVDTVKP